MKNNHLLKTAVSLCLALVIVFSVFIPAFAASGKWVKSATQWYYKYENGTYAKNKWEKINGKWYYFDSYGMMKTGWIDVNGKRYFLSSSGAMKTGWLKYKGEWYYLQSNGAAKKGWLKDNGKWYYLDKNYKMVSKSAMRIGEKDYYFDSNGAMHTGWKLINGKWYYYDKSGAKVFNKWIGKYFVDFRGIWIEMINFEANDCTLIEVRQLTQKQIHSIGQPNPENADLIAAITDSEKIETIISSLNSATPWQSEFTKEMDAHMDDECPYVLIIKDSIGVKANIYCYKDENLLIYNTNEAFFEYDVQPVLELL